MLGERARVQAVAAVLVGVVVTALGSTPTLAAPEQLSATATPNSGAPGTQLQIAGSGWPESSTIQLTTCGGQAIEGSVACDQSTVERATSTADGALKTSITLGDPPSPCPCVVRVSEFRSGRVVNIPVTVAGHPVAPLPELPPEPGRVAVVSATVKDTSSWKALFGAGASGDVVLVLRNTTAAPLAVPPLTLQLGRVGSTAAEPLALPPMSELPPAGQQTYRIPFELDAGVGGTYLLRGSLEGSPNFTRQTSHWAWGFFALDAVLVLLLVVAVFWRIGRSGQRHRATNPAGRHRAAPPPEPATSTVPLADLLAAK